MGPFRRMTTRGHEYLGKISHRFLAKKPPAPDGLYCADMAGHGPCGELRADAPRLGWHPATAISEAIALASMPLSLILVLIPALALRFRSQWGGLAAVAGWSVLISYIAFWSDQSARFAAAQQGCVASPALFIALVAAICLAIVIYTAPAKGRPS